MAQSEREKMLRAQSIGPAMIRHLEMIGVVRLADLRDRDPGELAFRINAELGRRHINATGVRALANLVALARASAKSRHRSATIL
jgi:hypothetical protein